MSYTVEVSFDLRKRSRVSMFQGEVRECAEKHDCTRYYTMHECEGRGGTMDRNHCVFVVEFDSEDTKGVVGFLSEVKRTQYLYVESVYEERGKYNLLYASSKYLRRMDKDAMRAFKQRKRTQSLGEYETQILSVLVK